MQYKKLFALLLALALVCGSLSGCASERQTAPAESTILFTDSLGRTVDTVSYTHLTLPTNSLV